MIQARGVGEGIGYGGGKLVAHDCLDSEWRPSSLFLTFDDRVEKVHQGPHDWAYSGNCVQLAKKTSTHRTDHDLDNLST